MNRPSKEQPTCKPSEGEALATFNHAAEELRFFKGQQWHVTNYALIAYAALAAAPSLVGPDRRSVAGLIAGVLVWVACLAAWRVLESLETSIERQRGRLDAARNHLPFMLELYEHWREHRSAMPWWRRLWNPAVMPVLVAVLFSGAVVATLVLLLTEI